MKTITGIELTKNCPLPERSLIGKRCGALTVTKWEGRPISKRTKDSYWRCVCDCGRSIIVDQSGLTRRSRKLRKCCGCTSRSRKGINKIHGGCYTAEYSIWQAMRCRCKGIGKKSAKNYKDRGIRFCDRWNNFENFLADLGLRPSNKHTLDRIDNNKGYSPENCRWADRITQANNTTRVKIISWNGVTKTVSEWARHLGINKMTLYFRVFRLNWPIERAMTTGAKLVTEKHIQIK